MSNAFWHEVLLLGFILLIILGFLCLLMRVLRGLSGQPAHYARPTTMTPKAGPNPPRR